MMESKRICRLLIVIFLFLALMFRFLYLIEEKKQTVLSDDFVSEAVENLVSIGIEIEADVIDTKIPEADIFCLDRESGRVFFDTLSSSLIPSFFGNEVFTTQFDTPSGTTLGIYRSDGDEYELGRLVFSEDDYYFNLSRKGVSMSGGEDPITELESELISKKAEAKITEIMEKLNSSNRFDYRISGCTFDGSFLIVTVVQSLSGLDVNGMHINFVFESDEIIIVSGNWITQKPMAKYHNTLTDGVNVLYELDFNDVSSIYSEQIVYTIGKTDDGRVFLLPSWEIIYADKNGSLKKMCFDAV